MAGSDAGTEPDARTPDCPPCDAPDRDGDGVPGPPCGGDCDDADPTVAPGLADPAGDGIDSDCDGTDGVDRDGDGFLSAASGGDDCDDTRAFVHPGAPDGQGWVIEAFPAGIRTRLALDRWGKPVVAWAGKDPDYGCPDDDWIYIDGYSTVGLSWWERGQWATERVEQACTSHKLALAIAQDGTRWMAYVTDYPSRAVRVAHARARDWEFEDLGPGFYDAPLVLDRCGEPYVGGAPSASVDEGLGGGRVWMRADDRWHSELFDKIYTATHLDLALSGAGQLAVSYQRDPIEPGQPGVYPPSESYRVAYATRGDGAWRPELIDEHNEYQITDTAIAFDSSGQPLVAYADEYGLWLVTREDGRWSRSVVDSRPSWLGETCCQSPDAVTIGVDREGILHGSFGPGFSISYATNRGGSWSTEELTVFDQATWTEEDGYPSMALDSAGGVHIVWYTANGDTTSGLPPHSGRYAVLARPNDGIDQNCDGVDGVDADRDGHPSIDTGGDDPDDADPSR